MDTQITPLLRLSLAGEALNAATGMISEHSGHLFRWRARQAEKAIAADFLRSQGSLSRSQPENSRASLLSWLSHADRSTAGFTLEDIEVLTVRGTHLLESAAKGLNAHPPVAHVPIPAAFPSPAPASRPARAPPRAV